MLLSPGRLLAVARKEVIQLRRDPRSLAMAFVVPAVMVVFFGYIINFDVKDITLAVVDQDRTIASRELVQAFEGAGRFRVTARPDRQDDVDALMLHGSVRMALVIPPGFARDLASDHPAVVQGIIDGADANTASISLNYATAIVTAYATRVMFGAAQAPPITLQSRVWYNETLASPPMIVPGLVAMIMMIIATMLTSLTVAREWERGTMEQLIATPVSRFEVIMGKLLPYVAIGLVDVTAVVLLGMFVFQVPFRGNPLLLAVMAVLFLLGSLGLGIFISAAVKSQLLATQTAMIVTYLPSTILSGAIFDIASMPLALRAISVVIPARYFIVALRGILLKGVGLNQLAAQAGAMLAYAVIGLGLAMHAFRKEIE